MPHNQHNNLPSSLFTIVTFLKYVLDYIKNTYISINDDLVLF
jgi:hypothetical protein